MKQISLKRKITLYTTLIFLGVLIVTGTIIIPSVRYIRNIKKSIDMTEAQIEETYQKIRLLKKSINELDRIKEETQKFAFITIDRGGELFIIRELEQLASQNKIKQTLDVTYRDGKPATKEVKPQKPNYVFKFTLDGTYTDLVHYLHGLENLPQYFIIDTLSIGVVQKDEKSDSLHISFEARIYSNE